MLSSLAPKSSLSGQNQSDESAPKMNLKFQIPHHLNHPWWDGTNMARLMNRSMKKILTKKNLMRSSRSKFPSHLIRNSSLRQLQVRVQNNFSLQEIQSMNYLRKTYSRPDQLLKLRARRTKLSWHLLPKSLSNLISMLK